MHKRHLKHPTVRNIRGHQLVGIKITVITVVVCYSKGMTEKKPQGLHGVVIVNTQIPL